MMCTSHHKEAFMEPAHLDARPIEDKPICHITCNDIIFYIMGSYQANVKGILPDQRHTGSLG